MIVSIPADPTRSLALAAYRPGVGYYDWRAGGFAPFGPRSLLAFKADPGAVPGDLLVATVPDAIAAGGDVVLQLVALGPDGAPLLTVDCEVIAHAG